MGLLRVKFHKDITSAKEIIDEIKECPVNCEERKPPLAPTMKNTDYNGMNMPMEMRTEKAATHDHHAMMEAELKRRFIVAAVFTIPVLILSPSIQSWLGYMIPASFAVSIVLAVSASIVILYGGFVFYKVV